MPNPLQSFLAGQQGAINVQQQRLALDQAPKVAAQNAAIRDVQLQRQKQQLATGEQDKTLKGAQLMGQLVNHVKQFQDPAQRLQVMENARPILAKFDVQLPPNLSIENVTDEGLAPLETGLGQTMQQLTSFQSNLDSQAQALVGSKNPDTGEVFTLDTAKQALVRKQAGIDPRAGTVASVERIATTPGLTESVASSRREIKTQEELGAGQAKTVTDIIDKSFEKIGNITSNIRNIDRAIDAIDRGAGTGRAERLLPSIKAASIELDNMRNQLGLDVVGATTFGALSKGELDLALDTALPTGLNEPQLREWLERKKVAQQKVVDYLDNQIDFLEGGGTIGQWRTLVTDAEDAVSRGADPEAVQNRLRQLSRGQ